MNSWTGLPTDLRTTKTFTPKRHHLLTGSKIFNLSQTLFSCVVHLSELSVCCQKKKSFQLIRTQQKSWLDPCPPVKSLFEAFSLDVKLEDGPLAVGRGVVTPAVLLQESIKPVFRGVLFTAHKHHWDAKRNQQRGDRQGKLWSLKDKGKMKESEALHYTLQPQQDLISYYFTVEAESDLQVLPLTFRGNVLYKWTFRRYAAFQRNAEKLWGAGKCLMSTSSCPFFVV